MNALMKNSTCTGSNQGISGCNRRYCVFIITFILLQCYTTIHRLRNLPLTERVQEDELKGQEKPVLVRKGVLSTTATITDNTSTRKELIIPTTENEISSSKEEINSLHLVGDDKPLQEKLQLLTKNKNTLLKVAVVEDNPSNMDSLDSLDTKLKPNLDTKRISAGICSPTLFGKNLNLTNVINWCQYYHNLGFDHIYIWYKKEITTIPNFDVLQRLEYVTVIENTKYDSIDDRYYGQEPVATDCIQLTLNTQTQQYKYDWLLFIDVDEYLWFHKQIHVQEFIQEQTMKYNQSALNYMSFGKIMYSMKYRMTKVPSSSNSIPDTIMLENMYPVTLYPYTPGHYCYGGSCSTWYGRSKIMMMPSFYPTYDSVHGWIHVAHEETINEQDQLINNGIHFNVFSTAHLKEWGALNHIDSNNNTIVRIENKDYNETNNDETMHWFLDSYTKTQITLPNGTILVPMKYDATNLHSWFNYVLNNNSNNNVSKNQGRHEKE